MAEVCVDLREADAGPLTSDMQRQRCMCAAAGADDDGDCREERRRHRRRRWQGGTKLQQMVMEDLAVCIDEKEKGGGALNTSVSKTAASFSR
ncbi:unnamed protein product [Lactuca virosa]|uniref:Uncharacterized protein n=1 Tax=Lactuca virosa TaxID=75947 RepID=A0AAU9MY14_9ASTR|nr:unnamed protein product [Lactuca virosa]